MNYLPFTRDLSSQFNGHVTDGLMIDGELRSWAFVAEHCDAACIGAVFGHLHKIPISQIATFLRAFMEREDLAQFEFSSILGAVKNYMNFNHNIDNFPRPLFRELFTALENEGLALEFFYNFFLKDLPLPGGWINANFPELEDELDERQRQRVVQYLR